MRWRYGALAVLAAALPVALAMRPADVRPDGIRGVENAPERVRRGRDIVERGVEAQGGWAAWEALSDLEIEIHDVWDWTSFRLYMPLQDDDVRVRGAMRLHDYARTSSWTILDGRGTGRRFGLRDGEPWKERDGRERRGGRGVAFYAPTMQYLLTLAFRVHEGDIVSWIDEAERAGVRYDRVLVTWDEPSAHHGVDQYVLYYRQDNGLLEYMECSVRDFAPFITGAVVYESWQTLDEGVVLPNRYEMLLWDLDGPRVHEVSVTEVTPIAR